MFCYQCEQTTKGTGCTQIGVCGKDETAATLQDLIVHATKGIAMYAHRAAKLGARDPENRSSGDRTAFCHGDERRFRSKAAGKTPQRRLRPVRAGEKTI